MVRCDVIGTKHVVLLAVFAALALPALGQDFPGREWTHVWGSTNTEWMHAAAASDDRSIYVVGESDGDLHGQTNAGGMRDMVVIKLATDGTRQWTRLCGSTGFDSAWGVGIDEGSNTIYVAGFAGGVIDGQPVLASMDLCLTKWDASGNRLWTRMWGSTGTDIGYRLALDSLTNIYVCGTTEGQFDGQTNNLGTDAICLSKFDRDGSRLWSRLWGVYLFNNPRSIACDTTNGIYVLWSAYSDFDGQTNAGGEDACITKWDPSGNMLWTRMWGSAALDYGKSLAVDSSNCVYAAGHTEGEFHGETNAGLEDLFLTKWDANGLRQWTRIWGSASNDARPVIAIDSADAVYVAAYSGPFDGQASSGNADLCLSKWNTSGDRLWTRLWGSVTYEVAEAIVTYGSGSVVVVGTTYTNIDDQPFMGAGDMCISSWKTSFDPTIRSTATRQGQMQIDWNGAYDLSFSVESSTNLASTGTWDTVFACSNVPGHADMSFTTAPPASPMFYRIRATAP